MIDSATPMTTAATTVQRKERKPPMTAAARARTSVSGPSSVSVPAVPACPAISMIDTVESRPAIAQTMVDTSLGLTPDIRARSGLSALAWTVLPNNVRPRNQLNAPTRTGTAIRIDSWDPATVMPPTCQLLVITTGNDAPALSIFGYAVAAVSASCEMPMVATSTITRGAENSRRMTTSSMMTANRTPTIRLTTSETPNGT